MQNTDSDTASGPNSELFVAVLVQIEKHPETWTQDTWRCDTGMCFAGWTTTLAGIPWESSVDVAPERAWTLSYVVDDGRSAHCSYVAARLLGIPMYDADHGVFAESNTLDDLYLISAGLLGVEEQVLRDKVAAVIADGATQAVSS